MYNFKCINIDVIIAYRAMIFALHVEIQMPLYNQIRVIRIQEWDGNRKREQESPMENT